VQHITIYQFPDGRVSLLTAPDALPIEAELADGYVVGPGMGGRLLIFGPAGTQGLTLEGAIESCVVQVPLLAESDKPKRS